MQNILVYDFDDVMTDNRVMVLQNYTEPVFVNHADGWGIEQLHSVGFKQIILSSEINKVASARAKKLHIKVLQDSCDKVRDLTDYCQAQSIDLAKVLCVGNDVNDLDVMRLGWLPRGLPW